MWSFGEQIGLTLSLRSASVFCILEEQDIQDFKSLLPVGCWLIEE